MAPTACALAILALFAQQWVPPKPAVKGNLNRAESDALKAKLLELVEVLREAAAPPAGYDAVGAVTVLAERTALDDRRLPVTGSVSVSFRPRARGGQPRPGIGFLANSFEAVLARTPYLRDESGPVYVAPAPAGQRGGFPIYESSSGRSPVLVLGSGKQPPFVPVTRERVLRARIGDARRLLEELEKLGAAAAGDVLADTRRRLHALEAELAAMPAEERSAEAYIGNSARPSGLADAGSPGARALVAPNTRLLDPSLPRAALRFLTFGQFDEYGLAPELENIRARIDLERVLKILE